MLCQAKGDRVDEDEKLSPAEAAPTLSPAGTFVLDAATGKPAAGSLPVDFCRSLDHDGPDGRGRYLVAVNSGYGLQFDGRTNLGQQSLAVIDLNAKPAPAVVQNIYFPTPQSACVGAVFALPAPDGTVELYVSGGFENKVWRFLLTPGDKSPVSPGSPGPDTKVAAPFIDLASLAAAPATRRYNAGKAAVYPLGLALGGDRLLAANDLDDSVGVVQFPRGNPATPALARVDLRRQPDENVYPYAVAALPRQRADRADAVKVYVLLWNAAAVAVFEWPPPPAKLSPGTPGRRSSAAARAEHPAPFQRPHVRPGGGPAVAAVLCRRQRLRAWPARRSGQQKSVLGGYRDRGRRGRRAGRSRPCGLPSFRRVGHQRLQSARRVDPSLPHHGGICANHRRTARTAADERPGCRGDPLQRLSRRSAGPRGRMSPRCRNWRRKSWSPRAQKRWQTPRSPPRPGEAPPWTSTTRTGMIPLC